MIPFKSLVIEALYFAAFPKHKCFSLKESYYGPIVFVINQEDMPGFSKVSQLFVMFNNNMIIFNSFDSYLKGII